MANSLTRWAKRWQPRLLLVLLAMTGGVAVAEYAPPETGFAGMQAHRIDEPVLGGHMVVYEGGRGHSRSVLLVHGIGQAGARDWRETVGWLQASFHVIAVDLPGFGASDKANALYSPGNYARVLKHVAGRFLPRPFALVGHSMGAVVALRYAAAYPQDVERLVVIDAPGVLQRYSVTSQFLAHLGMQFMPPWLDPPEELVALARRLLAPLERLRFDPQVILASPQLRERLFAGDPVKIAGLAVVSENLSTIVPAVRAETLILWGSDDTLVPLRTGRVLALKLPRAQLEVIERAGHTPMLEAPDGFRAALQPFLENGLPPASKAAPALLAKHGTAECRNERHRVFEGDYDRLTIEGCQQVRIRNARVRELRIINSTVAIDDSRVGGGATGLYASNATVVATGVRIEGEVAITALDSRLDLAAVDLIGSRAAVTAPTWSYVVFSFSRVDSPNARGEVHAYFTIGPANPL
ncbi:MAG: alpha/beta hydrolase [Burkholderiales bacterium]